MATKLQLGRGVTGFTNDAGKFVCTGSQMGRRDVLPAQTSPKLRLQRLRFVDDCYDSGGAYWGCPENVWCAWDEQGTRVFRRANSRDEFKQLIRGEWPLARFYR